jgi:RNA recognition motif-containing protein
VTHSETTSIPTNPRTTRPVGYAFVDVSTPSEAERAINELNGKTILDRKVSVQLARKPEPAAEGAESGEKEAKRRNSTRGRGRGRGRGGRTGRGGRKGETNGEAEPATTNGAGPTNVPGQVAPLASTTNEALTAEDGEGLKAGEAGKTKAKQPRKQRGPPEDGVPSKTKIMVANLPYDLREEKVRW